MTDKENQNRPGVWYVLGRFVYRMRETGKLAKQKDKSWAPELVNEFSFSVNGPNDFAAQNLAQEIAKILNARDSKDSGQ